jgi:uncharacterized protein YgfB (UPF0149 family)
MGSFVPLQRESLTNPMSSVIDHNEVEAALRASGSSWSAAQAHGLLCSRLAVLGVDGGADWLGLLFQDSAAANDAHTDDIMILQQAGTETYRQFADRQSAFDLLLPDESESISTIATAMAEWCEGFLHGLVSDVKGESLKQKLAAEPLSDIIRDMLEMTRAAAGVDDGVEGDDEEGDDEALTELIEYLRVAAPLVYEELEELRRPAGPLTTLPESDAVH